MGIQDRKRERAGEAERDKESRKDIGKRNSARIIVAVASFNPYRHTNLFFAGQSRQKYRIGLSSR